ncbi:CHAD domain-containing protein [Pseudomonas fluvialis]|uniref:CHAD domain-containing protein n=1 Tax=Pseudomonas fluvialis TaxID=1793966 RepID=A0A7X0BS01_9PSED|nr:CHAD domain-containing protein [Pseudomonas fluvialis]MBB6341695.1 CHAD domain-containing protein [Pseudomonas fluvialis]
MSECGRLLVQVLRLSAQLHLSAQQLREDDDEALHRLRIALRSLDALLRLLPTEISGSLRLRVRACARVSGVLRDYQVLAAQLPPGAGGEGIGLAQATAWLQQTGLLQQLQTELEVWPQQLLLAEDKALRRHLAQTRRRQWQVLCEALEGDSVDWHRLRLLIKQVRYSAELLPGDRPIRPRQLRELRRLQVLLGDWHDRQRWLELAQGVAALQPLQQRWQVELVQLSTSLPEVLQQLARRLH